MGVDGGSGHGLVAEELLDGFELGAMGEHGGGKAVAENVGGAAALGRHGLKGPLHRRQQVGVTDAVTADGEEEGMVGEGMAFDVGTAFAEVDLEIVVEFLTVRDNALLVTLTCYTETVAAEIDILHIDAHQFGSTDAGVVEEEEEGAVAHAEIVVAEVVVLEEAVHLGLSDECREALHLLGVLHQPHGIDLDASLAQQETVERPQRRHIALDISGRETALHLHRLPVAEVGGRQLGPRGVVTMAHDKMVTRHHESIAIGVDGAWQTPLGRLHIVQEVFYPFYHNVRGGAGRTEK